MRRALEKSLAFLFWRHFPPGKSGAVWIVGKFCGETELDTRGKARLEGGKKGVWEKDKEIQERGHGAAPKSFFLSFLKP